MRRLIAIVGGLALLAAVPLGAAAKPPTKFADHSVAVFCDALLPASGTGTAYLGLSLSDTFGSEGYLDVWTTSPLSGPPDLLVAFSEPIAFTIVNGVLSATIPMMQLDGSPAASATVNATLTPSGASEAIDESYRDGNQVSRVNGLRQPLAVAGSLAVAGRTFPLVECYGEEARITVFANNPNAYASHFASRGVGCFLTNGAGDELSFFVNIDDDPTAAFVEAFMLPAGGGEALLAIGPIGLVGGTASVDLETIGLDSGEPIADTTHLTMSLTAGEAYSFLIRTGILRQLVRGELIDVEGAITFPGGHAFDLGPCIGSSENVKVIVRNAQGPKPTGKAPANDVPAGAKAIKIGSTTVQQTKSAAPDAEAPYLCARFGDPDTGAVFEIPVQHTVWFKVTGTGGPLTIDTAGSSFDTVTAAYVSSGGGFTSVACDDDVPVSPVGITLQSAVTFPTTAGVTYWIQIGGYPDELPYGTLKVAVR